MEACSQLLDHTRCTADVRDGLALSRVPELLGLGDQTKRGSMLHCQLTTPITPARCEANAQGQPPDTRLVGRPGEEHQHRRVRQRPHPMGEAWS